MKTYFELLQKNLNIINTDYFSMKLSGDIDISKILWKNYFKESNEQWFNEYPQMNNSLKTSNIINTPEMPVPCPSKQSPIKDTIKDNYNSINGINLSIHNNREPSDEFIQYYFIYSIFCFYYKTLNAKSKINYKYITIKYKYNVYSEIINNLFLHKITIKNIEEAFHITQKNYFALSRFISVIRNKYAKIKNNTNLQMDLIDINNKYTIVLYHINALYLFSLSDLVNIIQSAITNCSDDLFLKLLFPKNPYNNIPFTMSNLYNIYYRIKFTYLIVPKWIQLFYEAEFNLKHFELLNQLSLQEISIRQFILNTSSERLYSEIIYMLRTYYHIFRYMSISKGFPKLDFVNIFRPYLYLFYIHENFIEGSDIRSNAKHVLDIKLQQFIKYSPNFGKKNISIRTVNVDSFTTILDLSKDNNKSGQVSQYVIKKKFIINTKFNKTHPPFTLDDAYHAIYNNKNIKRNISSAVIQEFTNSENTIITSNNNINDINDLNNFNDTDDFIDLRNNYFSDNELDSLASSDDDV